MSAFAYKSEENLFERINEGFISEAVSKLMIKQSKRIKHLQRAYYLGTGAFFGVSFLLLFYIFGYLLQQAIPSRR